MKFMVIIMCLILLTGVFMNIEDRYDSLIQYYTAQIFPELDWLVIKAQIHQESSFAPDAISSAKCIGLMQLSSVTAQEMQCRDRMNPEENIKAGIGYLKKQYVTFPDNISHWEKIKLSLASYNCGRGYILKAMELKPNANTWEEIKKILTSKDCVVHGKRPYYEQTIDYVTKIMAQHDKYQRQNQQQIGLGEK